MPSVIVCPSIAIWPDGAGRSAARLAEFAARPHRPHWTAKAPSVGPPASGRVRRLPLTHLQRLEAESIHIFREVLATADNPVLLYSIGKDSAVLLHLAIKAFYPAPLPFPLLHVDTTGNFAR